MTNIIHHNFLRVHLHLYRNRYFVGVEITNFFLKYIRIQKVNKILLPSFFFKNFIISPCYILSYIFCDWWRWWWNKFSSGKKIKDTEISLNKTQERLRRSIYYNTCCMYIQNILCLNEVYLICWWKFILILSSEYLISCIFNYSFKIIVTDILYV